jgi:hypothetical protein
MLNSVVGKLLGMSRTTWICQSIFWTVYFVKSKHRSSISDKNLSFKLKSATDFMYSLLQRHHVKCKKKTLLIMFMLIIHWNESIAYILG